MGGAIFGAFTTESVSLIAKHGLPGVEPYRSGLTAWLDKPQALKALLDEHGMRLITASNGGLGQSMAFIDPSKRRETIADHVAFCGRLPRLILKCVQPKIFRKPRQKSTWSAIV